MIRWAPKSRPTLSLALVPKNAHSVTILYCISSSFVLVLAITLYPCSLSRSFNMSLFVIAKDPSRILHFFVFHTDK